jgi:uncharacterized protein with GYD domain
MGPALPARDGPGEVPKMPKFLIKAHYTAAGLQGLQKDKASGRQAAVAAACESVGGKLDAIYYALGEDDAFVIVDLPSHVHAAKLAIAVGASGMIDSTTIPLLTVAEADEALGGGVKFRPPGG